MLVKALGGFNQANKSIEIQYYNTPKHHVCMPHSLVDLIFNFEKKIFKNLLKNSKFRLF